MSTECQEDQSRAICTGYWCHLLTFTANTARRARILGRYALAGCSGVGRGHPFAACRLGVDSVSLAPEQSEREPLEVCTATVGQIGTRRRSSGDVLPWANRTDCPQGNRLYRALWFSHPLSHR